MFTDRSDSFMTGLEVWRNISTVVLRKGVTEPRTSKLNETGYLSPFQPWSSRGCSFVNEKNERERADTDGEVHSDGFLNFLYSSRLGRTCPVAWSVGVGKTVDVRVRVHLNWLELGLGVSTGGLDICTYFIIYQRKKKEKKKLLQNETVAPISRHSVRVKWHWKWRIQVH